MFKVFATPVVVSKGFDENPALNFVNNGNIVNFRIGYKVYDPKAEDNTRWVNYAVKAFDDVCERIKKMKLKEGSVITIEGDLDEEVWEDNGETRRKTVIILNKVEYVSSGSSSGNKSDDKSEDKSGGTKSKGGTKNAKDSDNFKGFENIGDKNPFFES